MLARVGLIAVALTAAVVACTAGSPCPCGQVYDRDPFSSDPSFYVGSEHEESVHCFCRCGDDPPLRLAPSLSCRGYEGACARTDGTISQLACE